jgi:hypothetical protein
MQLIYHTKYVAFIMHYVVCMVQYAHCVSMHYAIYLSHYVYCILHEEIHYALCSMHDAISISIVHYVIVHFIY